MEEATKRIKKTGTVSDDPAAARYGAGVRMELDCVNRLGGSSELIV
jgi:hypothetical protein